MVEPREGEVNIQIGNSLFDSYQNLKIEKRLNEVDTFEFTAFITDDADRGLISEGQDILVFEDQEFIFKGRIEDTDYNSSFEVNVEGEGMATKLLDRKTDRDSFDNTPADQITQEIIPLDTVSEGVIEEAPLTSLSFDHDNIARAVAGAANAVGYDWQLRQEPDDDFDTDFLDFKERIGTNTEESSVEEGFESGEYDDGDPLTWIVEQGDPDNFNVISTTELEGDFALEIVNTDEEPGFNYVRAETDTSTEEEVSYKLQLPSSIDGGNFILSDTGDVRRESVEVELVREINLNLDEYIKVALTTFDSDGNIIDSSSSTIDDSETADVKLNFQDSGSTVNAEVDTSTDESLLEAEAHGKKRYKNTFLGVDGNTNNTTEAVFDSIKYLQLSGEIAETFKIGENARLMENEQDDGFVANDITLLGRGDGINQLEARVFAAANDFTQLQTEISEDQTNNFTVDDTTVLGDTDDTIIAKVGAELINCTIDDTTTLSINERGVENWEGEETPQILHRENISVWLYENITQGLGPYTPENQGSAQEGSSIADKGVKQLRETDKTVVKLPTLEQVADRELRNRFRSVQSVRVRTAEPRIGSRVELGDEIEVTGDLGTDLSGKYRVVGIDLNRRSSDEGTELICANRPRRLVERLSEIERDRDTLNAHMQGATNFNSESFGDNCDEDNPLRNKFYVPEDVVNINKFELTFARQSFRGYVQNEPHSHDFESFESSDTGEWTNQGMQIINDNVSSVSDPLVFVETPQSPTGEDSGVNITATVFNQDSSVGRSLDLDIVNETTGEVLKSESFTLGPGNLQTFNLTRGSNTVSSGDDIKAEINGNLSTDSFFNSYLHLDVSSKSSHDHEGTVIEGAGEPVYGIFEPTTEADVDVEVIVDGTTIQTVENVSVGEEIDDPVSIVEELDDPLTGRYHTVELRPVQTEGDENGRCRLQADIIQKVFIESTL